LVPVEEIAARVAAEERDGLWCLVGAGLTFVPADGATCETSWTDMERHALFERYVAAHPERVHPTMEAARAFVHARLCLGGRAERDAAGGGA